MVEPGERCDPETDRVLMFSDGGPTTNVIAGPFPPMFMNGKAAPESMTLRAGVTHRFRLIGITGDLPVEFKFMNRDKPVEWRAVAHDGMTLPAAQATTRPAVMLFNPGQIYDFELTPETSAQLGIQFGVPAFIFPPGRAPKQSRVPVLVR